MNKFCEKCGTELIGGVCPKCIQSEAKMTNRNNERFNKLFMSPSERFPRDFRIYPVRAAGLVKFGLVSPAGTYYNKGKAGRYRFCGKYKG